MKRYNLEFFKWFLANPKKVASIVPSSKWLSKKIINSTNLSKAKVIVELWAWTWPITDNIIESVNIEEITIILFEINKKYCEILKDRFWEKAIIINKSVKNFKSTLEEIWIYEIDVIISSLPIIQFDKETQILFFKDLSYYTKKWTEFRTISYTPFALKNTMKGFNLKKLWTVFFNIPPMMIYGIN